MRVLEDWSLSFEGLLLYYPGHRQVPGALIDLIRANCGPTPIKTSLQNPFA